MSVSTEKGPSTLPTYFLGSQQPSHATNHAYSRVNSQPVFVTSGVGEIKGPSKVEYVPYQRTIIDYQPVQTVEYIPVQRKVIEYQERKRWEQVPIEEVYTDFYTVQHITEYVPQIIPEKKIQYVPIQRIQNRIQYYPVERQIVYYPNKPQQYQRKQYFLNQYQKLYGQNLPFYNQDYQRFNDEHQRQYNRSAKHDPKFEYNIEFKNQHYKNQRFSSIEQNKLSINEQKKQYLYKSPIQYSRTNFLPRALGQSRTQSNEDKVIFQKTSMAKTSKKHKHHGHHNHHGYHSKSKNKLRVY